MEIVCKDIRLQNRDEYLSHSYVLSFSFEYENKIIQRHIYWSKAEVISIRRFLKKERMVKAMKKSIKKWFKIMEINIANQEREDEINNLFEEFNQNNKEIIIKI